MTIEMILLMTLFLSLGLWVSQTATNEGLVAELVEGPWLHVQGMIEDGVWVRAGASKSFHPHIFERHGSPQGDTIE